MSKRLLWYLPGLLPIGLCLSPFVLLIGKYFGERDMTLDISIIASYIIENP